MNTPLVSVVIPVYNGAAFLRDAIDSALGQTYERIEVVAVDDGSHDSSREIAGLYGSQVVCVHQQNQGVSAARNAGIAQAKGEFIAFLDQDDWWHPEKLTRQMELFEWDNRIGLVHTATSFFNNESRSLAANINPHATPDRLVGDCFEELLLENHLRNSSVVVRRSVLDTVGTCDLSIPGNSVQDYDLWLRIAQAARFAFVPEQLTVIRLHPQQGTWDRRTMVLQELALLLRFRTENEWRATSDCRERLARVYNQLAIASLDAGDIREARLRLCQALKMNWSMHRLALLGACYLPGKVTKSLKYIRRAFRRVRGREVASNLPIWASNGTAKHQSAT